MYDAESPEAKIGALAEKAVDDWYIQQGWYVLRASEHGGGLAAMVTGPGDKLVALDRLIMRQGNIRWVETKFKSGAIPYRKMNVLRHGVDRRNWLHYLKLQAISGCPGYLAIIQAKENCEWPSERIRPVLLVASLDKLAACEADGNSNQKMIFWDVGAFNNLGEIKIGLLDVILPQANLRPWADICGRLRTPTLPPQLEMFRRGSDG